MGIGYVICLQLVGCAYGSGTNYCTDRTPGFSWWGGMWQCPCHGFSHAVTAGSYLLRATHILVSLLLEHAV